MSETTYNFTILCATEVASDYVTQAGDESLTGTLEEAIALAVDLESTIELRNASGFLKGSVDADGNWILE